MRSQLDKTKKDLVESKDIDENTVDNPIDISDILNICKEYSKLGWYIQMHMEYLIENGIEEAVKSGRVDRATLPHIKQFLLKIGNNGYFGDAAEQAQELLALLDYYELNNPYLFKEVSN
jgi:hypothetical protein